jgi:translation initiation factor 5B
LSFRFKPKESVKAATGLRIQFTEARDVQAGMPFVLFQGDKKKIKESFRKEISENIKTDKQGIIAKADSLGSLEALLILLKQSGIPVVKAGIGSINKADIISAKANLDINELDAVIVGFNVDIDEEAREIKGKVKILTEEVIYKLIDEITKFRGEKAREIEKKRLMGLSPICKLEILSQHVFRNSNPAVFGVRILAGKVNSGLSLIDESGNKIGRVKNIQSENKSVQEANENMEVAISIPGVNFERVLGDKKFLYSDIGTNGFKNFKKNKDLLSARELNALRELAEIKKFEA